MFKKRSKKTAGEGGTAAPEREKLPGWKDADQKVKDWWIQLKDCNGNDPRNPEEGHRAHHR